MLKTTALSTLQARQDSFRPIDSLRASLNAPPFSEHRREIFQPPQEDWNGDVIASDAKTPSAVRANEVCASLLHWTFDLDLNAERNLIPEALDRSTQSLSVCGSMRPILAASARLMPSRTAASDRSHRLWLASVEAFVSQRSSRAE